MAASDADTFGAMYIGAMVTMGLYGLTTLQTYFYFVHYPKDSWGTKLLVSVLWVADTVHIIMMSHAMYFYLITSVLNPAAMGSGVWSLWTSIAFNTFIAVVVQSFYTKRIFNLCRPGIRWWLSSVIAFFVLAHCVFGFETVGKFIQISAFAKLDEVEFTGAIPFAIAAVMSDILIAATLCVLLGSSKSDFQDTNSVINSLILIAINRCVLTSLVAITEVIVFMALPKTFYFLAIDFCIGKLYANSLLATLNSRGTFTRRMDGEESSDAGEVSTSFHLASMVASNVTHPNSMSKGGVGTIGVSTTATSLYGDRDVESQFETDTEKAVSTLRDRSYISRGV